MGSFDSAEGGVITLGAWASLRNARGHEDPDVWLEFHRAADAAVHELGCWTRSDERSAVLSELCMFVEKVPASWRDAKNASAPLWRWLITVAARRRSRLRGEAPTCLGDAADDLPDASAMARRGQPESTRLSEEEAALVTPKQREALELRRQGLKHVEIAERTGNTAAGVKDLIRRGRKHLETRVPAPRRHDPGVLARLAEMAERGGDAVNAALLALRAAGATLGECAARLGITPNGVQARLKRWWRLRPRACDGESDTCPPSDALHGKEGPELASLGGDCHGNAQAPLARGRSFRPIADHRRRDPP